MEAVKTKENLSVKGEYNVLSFTRDLTPKEQAQARRYARGDKSARLGLPIFREYSAKNLVPAVGRNVLTRLLSGDTTYSGEINYGAIGDGVTAFTDGSTTLNNEIFRKVASDSSFDDDKAYIDWYIESGDCADDDYEEFGAFIDGTGSADSGQAFSLLITGGWTKSGSMFISLRITLSNPS